MADDNNNDDEEDKFSFAGKRAVFAVMLIVLGVLGYLMARNIEDLPPHSSQPLAFSSGSAPREIDAGFPVGGRIAQMFFAEGAKVKPGDILATLDKKPFEQALAAAKAQLAVASADYNKSTHIPTSNFNAIEEARANVETAQHVFDTAHDELEKRRSIMVAGQLDNVYADDVQNERDAELELERTRRKLAQEEDAAGNQMDRDQYKAAMQAAQVNVETAETNLAGTQLAAPFAGTIIRRASEVGAMVAVGAAVYRLSPDSP